MVGTQSIRRPEHLLARLKWPGSARHLALIRIVFCVHVLIILLGPSFGLLMALETTAFGASLMPNFLLDPSLITWCRWVGIGAACLGILGLFGRLTMATLTVAFVLTYHFYFRFTGYHEDWLYFSFMLLVLSCARCTDAWSVDAALKRVQPASDQLEYRWPVELMTLWFALLYVAAGLAKIFPIEQGLHWLTGKNIQYVATSRYLDSPIYWMFETTAFDYGQMLPFQLMAVGTLVVELSAGLLVLTRRLNMVVIPAIFALHFSIYLFGVPGFLLTAAVCSVLFMPSSWFRDTE